MKLAADTVSVSIAPAVEPVTTTEAKLHLRVDQADENDLIDRLIETARVQCEGIAGKRFITQTMIGGLADWPNDGVIRLPYIPLQSITSLVYIDEDDNSDTVSTDVYGVDTKLGLIYLKNDQSWPTESMRDYDPITVTWVAGYGAASTDVPAQYIQAMMLMIGHLFENRESVVVGAGVVAMAIPQAIDSLLMQDGGYYS